MLNSIESDIYFHLYGITKEIGKGTHIN